MDSTQIIRLGKCTFIPSIDGIQLECTCCNEVIEPDTEHYTRQDGEKYCIECINNELTGANYNEEH
jgi:hypothetical protein